MGAAAVSTRRGKLIAATGDATRGAALADGPRLVALDAACTGGGTWSEGSTAKKRRDKNGGL